MIRRTHDYEFISKATEGFHGGGFDPKEWVEDDRNIALVNEGGDLNLFQHQGRGMYIGHFFYNSRGKGAINTAEEMLDVIFRKYEVSALIGLTPVENLRAKWLTRKLGFKSHGETDTPEGRCELFILTRLEFEKDRD